MALYELTSGVDHHFELEPLSYEATLERFRFVNAVVSPKVAKPKLLEKGNSRVMGRSSTSVSEGVLTRRGSKNEEEAKDRWKKLRVGFAVSSAWKKGATEIKQARIATTAFWVGFTVVCGVLSVPPNEILLQETAGCIPTLFFIQYVWILLSFGTFAKTALFDRKVPIMYHLVCVFFSYLFPELCGYALKSGLPASIVMVLKSMVLLFNMLVGFGVLQKRYNFLQVIAVLSVSVGVSLASYSAFRQKNPDAPLDANTVSLPGLLYMAGALTSVAMLGATQEYICRKFGKDRGQMNENMFYMHFVGLPLFYSKFDSIKATLLTWWTSDRTFDVAGVKVPYFLFLVCTNTLMGDILKRGTSKLIALTSALTANLVVSFMRFVALIVSAYIINSPPLPPQVPFLVGASGILVGSMLYASASQPKKAPALQEPPPSRFKSPLPSPKPDSPKSVKKFD
jgi:UDP-xylose/UDP-N-acetylglucosamine transporter B4